ncbi:hypothetical protein [Planococcus faecalis]|uniref:glycosyl-4,4'-diaponeurosporenoate acyltransferase CrtO family protein n=1 Tax=Planococcus faecalis TaxID=1598147 RepID=UPI0034E94FCD
MILNYSVTYCLKKLSKTKSIRIKKRQDKLPTMNITLKNLKTKLTSDYLHTLIMQTYYAEFGHLTTAVLDFLCLVVNPSAYLLMAFICFILYFLFIFTSI